MFARTAVMRLRPTRAMLAVSPYSVFLKSTKGQFTGLSIQERGHKLAAVYRALPKAEKNALVAKAKHTTFAPKVRKPRVATAFAKFVKANYKSVAKLPFNKRLATLAKEWNAKK